jgi:hypothetical protein
MLQTNLSKLLLKSNPVVLYVSGILGIGNGHSRK